MSNTIVVFLVENWISILSLIIASISVVVSWYYRSQVRKDRIIDRVYGPLLKVFNLLLVNIQDYYAVSYEDRYEKWDIEDEMNEIIDDYLFFEINRDLRKKIAAFYQELQNYKILYEAAKNHVRDRIFEKMKDLGVEQPANLEINYILNVEGHPLEWFNSEEILLKGKTPKQELEDLISQFGENNFEIKVGGRTLLKEKHDDVDKILKDILNTTKKTPIVNQMNESNQNLVKDAEDIIQILEKNV